MEFNSTYHCISSKSDKNPFMVMYIIYSHQWCVEFIRQSYLKTDNIFCPKTVCKDLSSDVAGITINADSQ